MAYSVDMASNEMQRAQVFGITYRSDDYNEVIVLASNVAHLLDGYVESIIDIESAWIEIARRGLKKVN